jgi:cytochrome b561
VRARAGIVLVTALALAGADLVVQAVVAADSSFAHHRSSAWVEVSVGLFLLALALARLPSRLLATGAGVFAGGLVGNLASAAMHGRAVANPFVVGDVAFNLADVFVVAGIVVMIVATMRLAVRYRHLLPRHTIAVRIVRHVRARRAT